MSRHEPVHPAARVISSTARAEPTGLGMMLAGGAIGLPETLALAGRAEAAGIGVLGAGDGVVDNLSLMGALATVTTTPQLVTAITGWTRTPVAAALAGRTLQQLSGGRYRLGLGTMPRAWSEDWHDVAAERPLARMRDYVAAIHQAWRALPDVPVDHVGPYYRFRGYTHPGFGGVDGGSVPPISLAVSRPRMARLAGEIADGAIFNLISSPEWIAAELVPAVRRGQGEGRPRGAFELASAAYCVVDDDVDRAIERVRPALGFYFAMPYFADALRHHGFERELAAGSAAAACGDTAGMTAAVSDAMVLRLALVGDEAAIDARLADYRAVLDRVLLTPPILQSRRVTIELSERIVAVAARPSMQL